MPLEVISSTRPVVVGNNGAVASAHPLATQAGLEMLKLGGNATDAAIAMAVALCVVEPYMSGPGGVGFLLLRLQDGSSKTLNFSGNTPALARPELFTKETQKDGPKACLIPGNVAGWVEAMVRHGSLSLEKVFAPAIEWASEGFCLHPFNRVIMDRSYPRLNEAGRQILGKFPFQLGQTIRQPDLARTLSTIARHGSEPFYHGEIAKQIGEYVRQQGGFLTTDDLARYQPTWETPIESSYRGHTIRTCAPNCEGFQILQNLRLLEGFDLAAMQHNSTDYVHLLVESVKVATADRIRYGGDPKFNPVPIEKLLAEDYIATRRGGIRLDRAAISSGERWVPEVLPESVTAGTPEGMTTHLAAVDRWGNVASITQSLGDGFGGGHYVPKTGVALNNFTFWTEIDPRCDTPNLLQPGKRWSCCMSPVHVLNGNEFWFSISTPGSYGILHTTLQMLLNVVDFGATIQLAIEAPRFRVQEGTRIQVERRFHPEVLHGLTRLGHQCEVLDDYAMLVGGGHGVMIDPLTKSRMAGADPRRDGYALAY